MLDDSYSKLLQYALRLLARKRYTQSEIERKLKSKKLDDMKDVAKVVAKVVARLLELKYLNDEQYAKDYITNRLNLNPRGKWLIKHELKRKGITEDITDKVIESAKIDEVHYADVVVKKKQKALRKFDKQKKKEKITALLASRGFKPETIYKTIAKW